MYTDRSTNRGQYIMSSHGRSCLFLLLSVLLSMTQSRLALKNNLLCWEEGEGGGRKEGRGRTSYGNDHFKEWSAIFICVISLEKNFSSAVPICLLFVCVCSYTNLGTAEAGRSHAIINAAWWFLCPNAHRSISVDVGSTLHTSVDKESFENSHELR